MPGTKESVKIKADSWEKGGGEYGSSGRPGILYAVRNRRGCIPGDRHSVHCGPVSVRGPFLPSSDSAGQMAGRCSAGSGLRSRLLLAGDGRVSSLVFVYDPGEPLPVGPSLCSRGSVPGLRQRRGDGCLSAGRSGRGAAFVGAEPETHREGGQASLCSG